MFCSFVRPFLVYIDLLLGLPLTCSAYSILHTSNSRVAVRCFSFLNLLVVAVDVLPFPFLIGVDAESYHL